MKKNMGMVSKGSRQVNQGSVFAPSLFGNLQMQNLQDTVTSVCSNYMWAQNFFTISNSSTI